ncbi:MAG: DNA methyltransferase [Candidatus Jacksonbacteria bacterium]
MCIACILTKGKFIPQLVGYFIDNHIDNFKSEIYFKKGDIVLDPFAGSGTALIQANELGMHSIGIDVSQFNCMIAECKMHDYNFGYLREVIKKILSGIALFETDNQIQIFEQELLAELNKFNYKNFPNSQYKYDVRQRKINEYKYAPAKEKEFLSTYENLVKKYNIKLKQDKADNFLDKWYILNVRQEIDFVFDLIKKEKDLKIKKLLALILSRTIRSCRATTHSDLATLKNPQITSYYCWKHKKICKPIFSIKAMLNRYLWDTLRRVTDFSKIKSKAYWAVLPNDSRTVNILAEVKKRHAKFADLLAKQKIKGIFTSPPYVGQIDYHEQHAYAYDLFGFKRKDDLEIGPLYKGKGLEARQSYVQGIAGVLNNCKKYLAPDYSVFLVANDKFNLYPQIAEKAGMKIVNQFKRPVLNRTERDRTPYSEIIFYLRRV